MTTIDSARLLRPPAPSRTNEVVNVCRYDAANAGDWAHSPLLYYPDLRRRGDIIDVEHPRFRDRIADCAGSTIVLSGSLYRTFLANYSYMASRPGIRVIAWALGHNDYDNCRPRYPDYLHHHRLVALRDYERRYACGHFEWVPCASCKHPSFDPASRSEPAHEVVFYLHKSRPAHAPTGMPVLTNAGPDVDRAIRFLASGRVVVTNSYHGAYWGVLLGREVVVFDPFSSKFFGLRSKYRFAMAPLEAWREALGRTRTFPGALRECREANDRFADKVSELLADG